MSINEFLRLSQLFESSDLSLEKLPKYHLVGQHVGTREFLIRRVYVRFGCVRRGHCQLGFL